MKTLKGIVKSVSVPQTVVVEVETVFPHPLYGKLVKRRKRFLAHDQSAKIKVGDSVIIKEVRPLSARKRFAVDLKTTKGLSLKETKLKNKKDSPFTK